jgi:ornithine cyclodeaminase/alanine dehydrogenase-like protein (mu-crystallin family)
MPIAFYDAARGSAALAARLSAELGLAVIGRERPDQITIYTSLGHAVQDLAAAAYLHARATSEGIVA